MKLRHVIELLGNTVNVIGGLWIGLMALIVWDEKGEKFVEPNLAILIGEALVAGSMIGLGIFHFVDDVRKPQRNPWEILGDLSQIAFGVFSGWLFYQLWAHQGLTVPYLIPLLIGAVILSALWMWLGMDRIFNDLARFDRIKKIIRRYANGNGR